MMEKLDFTDKIIGKEKYFNSAVLVLVVELKNKFYILFQKRAKGVRQGGDISFPGGKVEQGETSLEAALRECYEEVGLSGERIEVKGKLGTLIIPSGILVEAFLGFIKMDDLNDLNINEKEVEEWFLIPLDFFKTTVPRIEKLEVETKPYYEDNGVRYYFPAKELNLPEMYHIPWKSPPREVYMYIYQDRVIWGITAEIVKEVLKYV